MNAREIARKLLEAGYDVEGAQKPPLTASAEDIATWIYYQKFVGSPEYGMAADSDDAIGAAAELADSAENVFSDEFEGCPLDFDEHIRPVIEEMFFNGLT